ncbi:MAG: DUF3343 domain-containing protein [Olsenella sp.]|jgi:hypothetical protein
MDALTATFVSHFGAMRFCRQCASAGWDARLMPVPRALSSSCGTCVRYEAPGGELFPPGGVHLDEPALVAREEGGGYVTVWEHEG